MEEAGMSQDLDQLARRLKAHVEVLSAEPRTPGSAAHDEARAYIDRHLWQAGFLVEEMRTREGGFEVVNLLTQPAPADEKLPRLIVGAHYDSVPGSPGADDNASAVAALLELATWIGPRLQRAANRSASLQLAAYDLEEYGLVGSFYHCRELHRSKIALRGMISLEMLGYTDSRPGSQELPPNLVGLYPDVANFIGVVANEASVDLLQAVVGKLKDVPGLPVEFIAVPGEGHALAETRLSDHASFWDRGYQALMITDTSFYRNPHYHRPSDTAQTLDYPFLAKVTRGVCEAVWSLLE
jgi:aminopeptidase YwaD